MGQPEVNSLGLDPTHARETADRPAYLAFTVPQLIVATVATVYVVTVATVTTVAGGGAVFQPLTTLTKAVAVALDIAGRPDTDDAYALNSVRKAYSLLNGGTFQDLVGPADSAPQPIDYGIDWAGVYRLEAEKTKALTRQLEELRAELVAVKTSTHSLKPQPWGANSCEADIDRQPSPRLERSQAQIIAALSGPERTGHELSRLTNIHLRTVQRRLKELMAAGMVKQAIDGITPTYTLASKDT